MTDFNADLPQVLIGAALGLGLAAAVGFRVFVPFLLVAIAAKSGQVHLAGGFEWLGTDAALVMFGLAALLEIAAYFIPYFDHLLDTVAGPAAVIAGTVLMASTLVDMAPWLKWAVALVPAGEPRACCTGPLRPCDWDRRPPPAGSAIRSSPLLKRGRPRP